MDEPTSNFLPCVSYRFTMAHRAWPVRTLELDEAIAQPYAGRVELVALGDEVALDEWIGTHVELVIDRGVESRQVVGVVLGIEHCGARGQSTRVVVEVGPALALLAHRVRSRVFQDLSVPEIVADVLGDVFEALGRRVDVSRLVTEHPPRDYCVQYRESDLAFVQRLLEEEGIAYVFAHEPDGEVMVLLDDVAHHEHELADLPLHRDDALLGAREGVVELAAMRRVRPGRAAVRQWDWHARRPDGWQLEDHDEARSGIEAALLFDDVDELRGRDGGGTELAELGRRRVARARRERSRDARLARARGNAIACTAGAAFALQGHDDPTHDRRWRIVRARHEGHAPEAGSGSQPRGHEYSNTLECVPAELEWVPGRGMAKPRIHGVQLATVTGPAGSEIHTDPLGRIRVCLHWDHHGRAAHASAPETATSCWIRVAQAWAGGGFGSHFVPRVGMEVLVSFVDGDPDQPVCIGCVGNGANGNAFVASAEPTRTGLRTASSPGGAGFNELSFVDEAGQEQVFLHAQRDHVEIVGGDHVETVAGDETRSVGGDRSTKVTGNDRDTVESDRVRVVHGGEHVTVLGNQRVLVLGGSNVGAADPPALPGAGLAVQGSYVVEASDRIELRCGSSSILLLPTEIRVTAPSKVVLVSAPTHVTLEPAAMTTFAPAAAILGGSSSLGLASEARLAGGTKTVVHTGTTSLALDDLDATLHANVIALEGDAAVNVTTINCTVEAAGSLQMSAPSNVRIASCGPVSLEGEGATVKLCAGIVALNEGG